ncbi:hypothetical protein OG21DRAFT_1488311 [Imleria badia]|nr:hypothetical protein OG21DRAFT_1488311 [Imleria badia]
MQSLAQLKHDIHPVVIISAYNKALKESLEDVNKMSILVNTFFDEEMPLPHPNLGWNQTNWAHAQEIEEEQVITQYKRILEFKLDLIITEKGILDTGQHIFKGANVSAIQSIQQ